jgi:hypothetical protein
MSYVAGVERTQSVMFPQSLEEYISEENPVRFIDAYVGSLDLGGAGLCTCDAQPDRAAGI